MKNKYLKWNRLFSIDIPVWNSRIIVTYGSNYKVFKKSFKDQPAWKKQAKKAMLHELKHIFKDRIHSQAVYSYNSKLQIHYIHIHKEPNIISLSKHTSHEALHATFQILQDKGITYTDSSEESYTYLQQYILEHILTNILTPTTD